MSNQEVEELKTLLKALDIRFKNDEISKQEYNDLKLKYEKKMDEQIALLKEKSFLRDLSYISISGSGKVTNSFISISGSGKVEGWKGGSISISGSGKITDEEINVSGSASLPPDLETNILKASGSLKVDGSLEVYERLSISGSANISGNLNANEAIASMSGSIKVQGSIYCKEADLSGAYKIDGDIICEENFNSEISSKSVIKGDLKCGGDICIEQSSNRGILNVENIISDNKIYLEGVRAKYVSGKVVKLGENCEIENIEEIN